MCGRNAELLAKLKDLSASQATETVVYLWGERGSGRSHLLRATLRASVQPERITLADDVDALDETGRLALLKLITGVLRIGVTARLAKTAATPLGANDPHDIELFWP